MPPSVSWPWTCCVFIFVFVALQTHHQACGLLTRAEKEAVLKAHNDARREIHPKPCKPLPKLTWDDTLANVAQDFADKCRYEHNHRRTAHAKGAFPFVGENLYITTMTSESPSLAVVSWEREKADYTYHDPECNRQRVCGKCTPDQQCGHYTQLVWNTTTKVGCGIQNCRAGKTKNYPFSSSQHPTALIFVCNYGPGGNYAGQHPYATCPATAAVVAAAAAAPAAAKVAQPVVSANNIAAPVAAAAAAVASKSSAAAASSAVQMNTLVTIVVTAMVAFFAMSS